MTSPSPSRLFGDLDVDVEFDAPIGALTWFGIGGRAQMLVRPRNEEALATLLERAHQSGMPVRFFGGGANLLVDDDGVDGLVIRLNHDSFTRRRYNREGPVDRLHVMAGADLFMLVNETSRQGLDGMSHLAGIPGTLGGALRMNAGGVHGDTGQCVESVSMMDHQGRRMDFDREQLQFDYRRSSLPNGIITAAVIRLYPEDPVAVRRTVREIFAAKSASQPLTDKSAGCTFRNPPSTDADPVPPAGQLIDQAGLKGLQIGGATVSSRHANFISTTPQATARDVQSLIALIQRRVEDHCGILLQTEVVIWRDAAEAGDA